MCSPGQPVPAPSSAAAAVAMAEACLEFLARTDAGSLTAGEQAQVLRGLERAASRHAAARAAVLAGFRAARGFEADGHGGVVSWLAWQTRVTSGAAAGAAGWMRRLAAHPARWPGRWRQGMCRCRGRVCGQRMRHGQRIARLVSMGKLAHAACCATHRPPMTS